MNLLANVHNKKCIEELRKMIKEDDEKIIERYLWSEDLQEAQVMAMSPPAVTSMGTRRIENGALR